MHISTTVISEPDDVTVYEGRSKILTCVLNSNIGGDVQWYRYIMDTGTTVMVDQYDDQIGNTLTSSLTITNAEKFYTGYYWVKLPSGDNVCNTSVTVIEGTCMYVNSIIILET